MPPKFREVWKEFGVDEADKDTWMMVPLKGYSIVYLEDGKGLDTLKYDKTRVNVWEVKSEKEVADAVNKVRAQYKDKDKELTNAIAIIDSIKPTLNQNRLFLVKGEKGGGDDGERTMITVMNKAGTIKTSLKFRVFPKREVKPKFNFVQTGDVNGGLVSLTKWEPSHIATWLNDLGSIFSPQVNVWFKEAPEKFKWVDLYAREASAVQQRKATSPGQREPKSSPKFKVDARPGSLSEQTIADLILRNKDDRADVNVFLVGGYAEGKHGKPIDDPNGVYRNDSRTILLDDRPDYNKLMLTMSHELAHFLGSSKTLVFGHAMAKNTEEGKRTVLMESAFRTGNKIPSEYWTYFNRW